jgi:hypothetical protein
LALARISVPRDGNKFAGVGRQIEIAQGVRLNDRDMRARIRACDFFCIIDTLTSASMRPGVNGNIEELLGKSRLYRSRPQRQYVKALVPAAAANSVRCRIHQHVVVPSLAVHHAVRTMAHKFHTPQPPRQ